METTTARSSSLLTDVTFVIFLILNIVQFVTIIATLIYAIADVYRRCNSPSTGVRSNHLLINGGNENVAFVGGGVPKEAVLRFRNLLEPKRVGKTFLGKPARTPVRDLNTKKAFSVFSLLKRGHEPEDDQQDAHLFEVMGKDPLVYVSAVTSKFARDYSPFRAKAFMTRNQLKSKLVYPQPMANGSAFVLPTGHVINKAVRMTKEDLISWNPPPSSSLDDDRHRLTMDCANTDPVHRINVYGFAGSRNNKRAKQAAWVEMLVCNCSTHVGLLEAPDTATFSSNPDHIQVDIVRKCVLFPGAGTEPLQSRQVTAAASTDGELFKPVYGSGLVTLPTAGAPISLNCPCTDRPDGIYPVTSEATADRDTVTILQRDIVGYLNANPVDTSKLLTTASSSWIVSGKSVTSITCKGERIEKIE